MSQKDGGGPGLVIMILMCVCVLAYYLNGRPDLMSRLFSGSPYHSRNQLTTQKFSGSRAFTPEPESGYREVRSRRSAPRIVQQVFGCTHYPCIIYNSPGGETRKFEAAAHAVRQTNGLMIVHGECSSACVVAADIARDHFCMSNKTHLGFHMGRLRLRQDGRDVTLRRRKTPLSEDIDEIVMQNGGYPYRGMNMIPYRKIRHIWRECTDDDWSGRW